LFIAPSTIKKHLENIHSKLEVGGRTEAIARAPRAKIARMLSGSTTALSDLALLFKNLATLTIEHSSRVDFEPSRSTRI
jgi:hypothetical protein